MWSLRHHRKGLYRIMDGQLAERGELIRHSLWHPRKLNWWIGTLFACGSLLFVVGGILSLAPVLAASFLPGSNTVNAIFFAGSIPFTSAAFLQLYQSANAPELVPGGSVQRGRKLWFGWQPGNIGWLSSALQFLGTLLFNVNTFDAMLTNLDWLQQDLVVWVPDMAGSALFLASAYLAFIEYNQTYWAWQPHKLSWQITFLNLLGSVAFIIAAVLAFVPSTGPTATAVTLSILFTVLGAAAFLAASLLLWPEAAQASENLAITTESMTEP